MKNTKINYKWTANEDSSKANNNYSDETDYIIVGDGYDFGDYLNDNGSQYEKENGTYYILDEDGERTGEAYQIISTEETDEELMA